MKWLKWLVLAVLLLLPAPALADGPDKDGRIEYVEQPCKFYVWRLMSWETLQPSCTFWIWHDGNPSPAEVDAYCGSDLSAAWYQTASTPSAGAAPDSGYYLLLDKIAFSTCKKAAELPAVKFNYSIRGNIFDIWAAEPLPEHEIVKINGRIGGHPFECLSDHCQQSIYPTGPRGIKITWQAVSTFSEQPTPTQTIYMRYQPPAMPELVDSQNGTAAQRLWGSFPAQDLPGWLNPVAQESSEGFTYLAGRIIGSGLVGAEGCHNAGLMANGYASVCGLNAAWAHVLEYQNRSNEQITLAAASVGIPGQLLKRLIAIESQFWPSYHINWGAAGEAGPGQLTHNGADTLLLWDSEYYQQICQPLLGDSCSYRYYQLSSWQRQALQNEVLKDPGFEALARALRANAAQVDAIVRDETEQRPGAFLSHQDLWRLALVNYNAGPGCVRGALRDSIRAGYSPDWDGIKISLGAICPAAVGYVERVTATPLPYHPQGH